MEYLKLLDLWIAQGSAYLGMPPELFVFLLILGFVSLLFTVTYLYTRRRKPQFQEEQLYSSRDFEVVLRFKPPRFEDEIEVRDVELKFEGDEFLRGLQEKYTLRSIGVFDSSRNCILKRGEPPEELLSLLDGDVRFVEVHAKNFKFAFPIEIPERYAVVGESSGRMTERVAGLLAQDLKSYFSTR